MGRIHDAGRAYEVGNGVARARVGDEAGRLGEAVAGEQRGARGGEALHQALGRGRAGPHVVAHAAEVVALIVGQGELREKHGRNLAEHGHALARHHLQSLPGIELVEKDEAAACALASPVRCVFVAPGHLASVC